MVEYEPILQQLVIDVCQSMLGLSVIPSDSIDQSALQLSASVVIRGVYDITVEVRTNDSVALRIAEVMFSSQANSLSRDEIRDALGEIANMVGGNLKGILGDEAQLTLPVVTEISGRAPAINSDGIHIAFDCDGEPLVVVLFDSRSCAMHAAVTN